MLALALTLALVSPRQYPLPEERPECKLDPASTMVFKWAVECPTHTLRFEFKDDGTFRGVCVDKRTPRPKRAPKVPDELSYSGG